MEDSKLGWWKHDRATDECGDLAFACAVPGPLIAGSLNTYKVLPLLGVIMGT